TMREQSAIPEPSVAARLDAIDRQILKELQDDGRITNVELARRVGISAPPCLRRVRALEQAGYIKGYRALLDEKLLGYEMTVFAMVHLRSRSRSLQWPLVSMPSTARFSRSCRMTAASPMSSSRAGSASRLRPACAACARSNRPATSRAIVRCSTRSFSATR